MKTSCLAHFDTSREVLGGGGGSKGDTIAVKKYPYCLPIARYCEIVREEVACAVAHTVALILCGPREVL